MISQSSVLDVVWVFPPSTQQTLTLVFQPRLSCHGESMWFPIVAMGISSPNISSAIIHLSVHDLFPFLLSITLFFVSLAEHSGWQWAWLREGQLMSLDSRQMVFSRWPWASVTLWFSSHTSTHTLKNTNEYTLWNY